MMNKFKKLSFIILAVTGGISGYAQQKPISLEECIKVALENNVNIKNGQLDIQNTEWQVKEAKSGFMPTIDVNGQYQYYMNVPAQYIPASTFGGPVGVYSKVKLGIPQNSSANVQVKQTFFDQKVLIALKAAKVVRQASDIQLMMTKEDIIYNVTATYYNVQVLSDNLDLIKENIVNLEKTVKANEILRKNEIVSGSAYKRLFINLENLKNQFQNQKLSYAKNLNLLKYLMNAPLSDSVSVMPFDYSEPLEKQAESDVNQRLDIRLQSQQIKIAEFDKKRSVAGFYPTLSGSLYYGFTGYNGSFAPLTYINNNFINGSYFTVSLQIPVFDGFKKRSQVRQKEVTLQKSRNTLEMQRLQADREIQDATNDFESNKNLLDNSKRSLELAEQLFKDANVEYSNGIISITDLINVQDDLSDARNNFSTSLINLKTAELQLKKANGTLYRP